MTLLREALRELPDATFVDLYESDDAYLVVLDLPGVDADDVVIEGGRASVEIVAERDTSVPEGYEAIARERDERVEVTLPLPPEAVGEDVTTSPLERGVLELTIPRNGGGEASRADAGGADTGGGDAEPPDGR